jgi:hypothetical protein
MIWTLSDYRLLGMGHMHYLFLDLEDRLSVSTELPIRGQPVEKVDVGLVGSSKEVLNT